MANTAENLKFLRNCGVQEWLLDGDENFSKFINWFTSNVSADNIYTKAELAERQYLKEHDEYKNDVDLEAEKQKIALQYPNIWQNTEQDVLDLERQKAETEEKIKIYSERMARLRTTRGSCTKDIAKLAQRIQALENEEEKLIEKCSNKVGSCQASCVKNHAKICELNECYTKPQSYPVFMHQMSLEQYLSECDLFNTNAEAYLKNNFKVDVDDDDDRCVDSGPDLCSFDDELAVIIDRLYSANYGLHIDKIAVEAQKALIESLKTDACVEATENAMRRSIEMMRIQNEQEYAPAVQRMSNELENKLMKIAKEQAELVIYENNKEKLERAEKRKHKLTKFHDIVSNGLLNAELVWALMQIDIKKVKKRNDFDRKMDEYRAESQQCMRRMAVLGAIKKMNDDENLLKHFVSQMHSMLGSSIAVDSLAMDARVQHVVAEMQRIESSGLRSLDAISQRGNKVGDKLLGQKIDLVEGQMNGFLKDGPVDRYQFWDIELLKSKAALESQSEEIAKKMDCVKEELRQYCSDFNEKHLWRQKQLLWIWFLTEPNKLVKAVKAIKAKANCKQNAEKQVTGLLRKQT